ncbi:MAG: hypothetical protein HYS60_02830 [Candidatus Wildermuthbacteria bacterium]|nr:hypothetical protein [Candidatus Wildermuthbacteria bacterium]
MNSRFLYFFIAVITLSSFAVRVFPHVPNFTPVGALALFVGVYFIKKHWYGIFLPLALMLFSDSVIGFYDFKLMAVVYLSILGYCAFGMLAAKKMRAGALALCAIGGALLFYLATNFAVWAFSPWYPHNLQGLMLSYNLALPFFRYTILGDLFFTGVFFGAYEFSRKYLFCTNSQIAQKIRKVGI